MNIKKEPTPKMTLTPFCMETFIIYLNPLNSMTTNRLFFRIHRA